MLLYQAALPLSTRTLHYTARLIRALRQTIGCRRPALLRRRTRCHGVNLQALADPDGNLIRVCGGLRGSVHDTAAARIWQIPRLLRGHGLFALGDKGYQSLAHDMVVTPFKDRGKPERQKEANRLHARRRGPGERVFTEAKKWRVLHQLRCDPHRAAQITRAAAALNHQERT